jgi:hypothetical protein
VTEIQRTLAEYIHTWQTPQQLPKGDPLAVQLPVSSPTYLPLLQDKTYYSHYGLRTQRQQVLGLTSTGEWIWDSEGRGKSGYIYRSTTQCFSLSPFSLFPLAAARTLYPELATLIWDVETVQTIEQAYLDTWTNFLRDIRVRQVPAALWLFRSSYSTIAVQMGRLESEATCDALLQALESPIEAVRVHAVEGLGRTSPGRGFARAVEGLASDPSEEVREAVAQALERIGSEANLLVLMHLFHDAPKVQLSALDALVVIGAPTTRALVVDLLSNWAPDRTAPEVTLRALLSLQSVWQPGDVDRCLAALVHVHPYVRAGAAYVLGATGIQNAASALYEALWDGDPLVRVDAAYALKALGKEVGIRRMRELVTTQPAAAYIDPISGQLELEACLLQFLLENWADAGNREAEKAVRELRRVE